MLLHIYIYIYIYTEGSLRSRVCEPPLAPPCSWRCRCAVKRERERQREREREGERERGRERENEKERTCLITTRACGTCRLWQLIAQTSRNGKHWVQSQNRGTPCGGEVRHGVTSGVSCETCLNEHVTPHLHRECGNKTQASDRPQRERSRMESIGTGLMGYLA